MSVIRRQIALELDPAARTAARARWKGSAAQLYFGSCDSCGRARDDDGSPLLVARQASHRKRECFACWSRRRGRRRT